MQTETAPTTAECRALRASLRVTNAELTRRTGYGETRIARVLNDGETSQPLVSAVHAALVEIRDEQSADLGAMAAGGDRKAMDRLDSPERSTDPTKDGSSSALARLPEAT